MYLIDKYRSSDKEDAFFHKEIVEMLDIISKDESTPCIIFHGPKGSGKKTLINIYLKMLFGKNVENIKNVSYEVESSGGKKTIEKIKQSLYHIEIKPKGTNYDRYLIHDVARKYARNGSVNPFLEKNKEFKIVIINKLDDLLFCSQAALRRIIEVYTNKCRFIMCCESLSDVIQPLRSRCLCIRVSSPSDNDIFKYVINTALKENYRVNFEDAKDITKRANGNIKNALWGLTFKIYGYDNLEEYGKSLDKIIELLIECDLRNMDEIKKIYSDLMITNFSGNMIMSDLIDKIFKNENITDEIKRRAIHCCSDIEHWLKKCRRSIIHLDALSRHLLECFYDAK